MKTKRYDFHFSSLHPFDFEVMEEAPFSAPLLPFHDMHPAIHLGYLYAGDMGSGSGSCHTGECYLVPPWLPHQTQGSVNGYTLGLVTIRPEVLSSAFFEKGAMLHRLLMLPEKTMRPLLDSPVIRKEAAECFTELRNNAENRPRQFAALILFFAALTEEAERRKLSLSAAHDPTPFLALLNALNQRERGALRENEAAALCAMSVSSFSRKFHRAFRETFRSFELRLRLHRASGDLLGGRYTVKEVADRWDFCDASHLGKLIKKHFGFPPGHFTRKTVR